jgi:hypothetical protein
LRGALSGGVSGTLDRVGLETLRAVFDGLASGASPRLHEKEVYWASCASFLGGAAFGSSSANAGVATRNKLCEKEDYRKGGDARFENRT